MAAGPIKHVVIIVKENHGYDNYFGQLPGGNGTTMPHSRTRRLTTPTTATPRG